MKVPGQRSQGADVFDGGVRYRTWAPGKNKVEVVIFGAANFIDRVEDWLNQNAPFPITSARPSPIGPA